MLGPFGVVVDGSPLKLAGPKQRAVLSLLALNANTTVSLDRLIDGLWGEEPPPTAPKMVQQYVSQLRRVLENGSGPQIETQGRGYRLEIAPEAVDAVRFERLIKEVRAREALELWQGAPLADLIDEPFAAGEIRRLEELHLTALELMIEGEIAAGHHAEAVGRLRMLVDENPLRERLRSLLMLALYRSGRQAEALDAFRDARWTLVETLGLEPGPELRRLQEAILRQDPTLEQVVPDEAWASEQTVQQLGAGAGRVSRARGELRADERALVARVIDLQTLRGRGAEIGRASALCPFKGLEYFDVGDAELFFGRETLVAEIVARLPGRHLLGVVGASGSGKSSTVRAGLLPALAAGVLPTSERWTHVIMRPGPRPLAALRAALHADAGAADPLTEALGRVEPASRLLLFVDQFEETFTACADARERQAFLDALVAPALRGDEGYLAVIALRADYYGACAQHPQLASLLGRDQVLVGPMRHDEIARTVQEPAARAQIEIDSELVSRLVEETAGRPGGLPLLSTTLLELWEQRSDGRMTLRSYERTGGVRGAVARLAEAAYADLTAEEARTARNIFLRLAGTNDGEAAVRRRVPLEELDVAHSEAARRVLAVLTDRRLLTVGGDSVEVAHEALLREWPRLRGWLEEDAEARRLHRHVTDAATGWEASGRDPAELYRGARLAAALDFAASHGDELNALEREFLDEARLVSEREALRTRRMNRRLRALLAAALVGLVAAAAGGVVALDQRGDAREAATAADAQRLGAQALTDERVDHGLLLARAGVALDDSAITRGNLLTTLLKNPPALLGVFARANDVDVRGAAISPSGDLAAVGDASGTLQVFSLPDRRPVGTYRLAYVQHLAFSPDGRTLAVAGQDPLDSPAIVDLVDSRTLRLRRRIHLPRFRDPWEFMFASPLFTPDGRELLVLQTSFGTEQGHRLDRIDIRTGRPKVKPLWFAVGAHHKLLARADRRRAFVTSLFEDVTFEVDTTTMRVVRRHPAGGVGALHPDGSSIVLGGKSGQVRELDLATGRVRRMETNQGAEVTEAAFAPDGRTIATAGRDGSVVVLAAASRTERERLEGHGKAVESLVFAPAGRTLLSAGTDGRAFLWDVTQQRRLVRRIDLAPQVAAPFARGDNAPQPVAPPARAIAVSRSGRTLATTNGDGSVDLIDTGSLVRRASLQTPSQPALAVAFSPDDRLIATAGPNGQVGLWDARTRALRARLRGLRGEAHALAFSPDGKLIAASDTEEHPPWLRIWDVRRGRLTAFRADYGATGLAFNGDGTMIAVAGPDGPVEIRDVRSGRLARRLDTVAPARVIAYSPDRHLIFVGLSNGAGQFFSAQDGQAAGETIRGQDQRLTAAVFTADGRTLVTASADGTILLWDVPGRKPIGAPITVAENSAVSAALSPRDGSLYALSTETTGLQLTLSEDAWKRHACAIAGREMTAREWSEALPGQPYRKVCGSG